MEIPSSYSPSLVLNLSNLISLDKNNTIERPLQSHIHGISVGPKVHCLGRDLNSQVFKHRELGIPKLATLWWPECDLKVFLCFSFSTEVLVTLTADVGRILSKLHAVQPKGEMKFVSGVRIAHVSLGLKVPMFSCLNWHSNHCTTKDNLFTYMPLFYCLYCYLSRWLSSKITTRSTRLYTQQSSTNKIEWQCGLPQYIFP